MSPLHPSPAAAAAAETIFEHIQIVGFFNDIFQLLI
jgi:hypothetical protein